MARKKVNANDMLHLRRFYKALSSNVCLLGIESEEMVDRLFFTLSIDLRLWYKLFRLANLDWVSLRSISDLFFLIGKSIE